MRNTYKKLFMIIMLFGFMFCSALIAQENDLAAEETKAPEQVVVPVMPANEEMSGMETFARKLVGGYMVQLFIDGGWLMWPLLFLGIWGLALVIWKLLALQYAKINVVKFLNDVIPLIKEKKYADALEVANKTRGPVAAITYAGLLKVDRGIEAVEKSIENTASVEMAFLERQMISMSTVINLAPLVGFFGTILGMIVAFDAIAAAGDIDPTIVAEGIELALITTMAGLAVAIPVQLFYNIILQMIDNAVLDMQRASDKIIETLVENK